MLKLTRIFLLAIVLSLVGAVSADSAQELFGSKAKDYGHSSMSTNVGASVVDQGVHENSVDLYTGQHRESFSLATIKGRHGSDITLSLHYDGNVTAQAKLENHEAQAGPFGLGFRLDGQTIVCNHQGTSDIDDDNYYLIVSGSSIALHHVDSNRYVGNNGTAWNVQRYSASISGHDAVVGWTVTREDGTVYRFGDFDSSFTERNATRYLLRFGNFIGSGITNDDQPYPIQWDLSSIEDTEGLSPTTFDYLQEDDYLRVMDSGDNIVNSAYPYTRYSHLVMITSPTGGKIILEYSSRLDYREFYGVNIYEFYATQKADRLIVTGETGDRLAVVDFDYEYLTSHGDNDFRKLLLSSFTRKDGAETNSLPTQSFEYYTNLTAPKYGAMQKINLSSGAIKEINYAAVPDSEVVSQLSVEIDDDANNSHQSITKNMIISVDENTYNRIAFWDGRWWLRNLNHTMSQHDRPAVSPKGWAAVFCRYTKNLYVYRWRGGYFSVDTLSNLDQFQNHYGANDRVYLYPGKDCFVAINGEYKDSPMPDIGHTMHARSAAYYRWDGATWHAEPIFYDGGHRFRTVAMANDMFVISRDTSQTLMLGLTIYTSKVDYGKFDFDGDSLVTATESIPALFTSWYLVGGRVAAGPNYVGFQDRYHTRLRRWENGQFTSSDYLGGTADWQYMRALAPLPNGVAFTYDNNDRGHYGYLDLAVPRASGFKWVRKQLSNDNWNRKIDLLWGNGHSLVSRYDIGDGIADAVLWEWDGNSFEHQYIIYDEPDDRDGAELYRNSWTWGSKQYNIYQPTRIRAGQYRGNGNWSGIILNTSPAERWRFSASDNWAIGHFGTKVRMYLYNPFYFDSTSYHSYDILTFSPDCGDGNDVRSYSADDMFCLKTDQQPTCGHTEVHVEGYKLYDTLVTGKPTLVAVSSVKLYEYVGADPIVTDYKYRAGLINTDNGSPRFTKSEMSLPYFQSEGSSDGYEVTYFFNDLDTTLSDGHYAETVGLPDFTYGQGAGYGFVNAGYWLDGLPYLKYVYSAGGDTSEIIDYTKYCYRLFAIADSLKVPNVYRPLLVEDTTVSKGILTQTTYTYDRYSGLVEARYVKEKKGYSYRTTTEVTQYAYKSDDNATTRAAMKADNALAQVSLKAVSYSDIYGWKSLSRKGTRYEKHGMWQPVTHCTWRDVGSTADTLFTLQVEEFDEWGNITLSTDANGVTTSYKYDSAGVRVVATANNAEAGEFWTQDFEQGKDWDGWTNWIHASRRWFDSTDAFTGKYSYHMEALPNPNDHGWGPKRFVTADSLQAEKYFFSAWLKSNHAAKIGFYLKDSLSQHCPGSQVFSFDDLSDTAWQRVEGIIDLTGVDFDCLHRMTIVFVLTDYGSAQAGDYVKFDDFRFHPLDAHAGTAVYDKATGLSVAQTGLNNVPERTRYDSFHRLVSSANYRSEITQRYVHVNADPYTVSNPNSIKEVTYASGNSGFDSTVTVQFFSSLGRLLQTRTTDYVDTGATVAAMVSGVKTYDGRGRILREYKPYNDVVGSVGVDDYTRPDSVLIEASAYYNGTYDVNCQGYPYTEFDYDDDFRGRLTKTSQPGYDWRLNGGHVTQASYEIDPDNWQRRIITLDPDGVRSVSTYDVWDRIAYDSSFFTGSDGSPAVSVTLTYEGPGGQVDSVAISDGVNRSILRRYVYSDHGLESWEWAGPDYHNVWKYYDKAGNLRFVQDDKLNYNNQFIYYKYDFAGRLIEEGLSNEVINSVTVLTQDSADSRTFPDGSLSSGITRKYSREYDHKATRTSFGSMVYTGASDSSYYKEFHYYPFAHKDSIVVKLKMSGGDLKSIVHEYDGLSGQKTKMTVYPYQSTVGARSTDYGYDLAGRLKRISEGSYNGSPLGYERDYVEYDFYCGGRIKSRRLGRFEQGATKDTLQILHHAYDPRGMLIAINDPDSVTPFSGGTGEANSHFGLRLDYTNGGAGYYNGRVAAMKTANSSPHGIKTFEYGYTFNEMGWLTNADNVVGTGNDRTYWYNYIGNRDSTDFGGNVRRYNYCTTTPASSRLWSLNTATQKMFYDRNGNLQRDDATKIYDMHYDYRNLIEYAQVEEAYYGGDPQELFMAYDENSLRIYKRWHYCYKAPCDFPIPDNPYEMEDGGGGKSDGKIDGAKAGGGVIKYCPYWADVETHYLYDGGTLLMVFNGSDEVLQYYVTDQTGKVAVYPDNNASQRTYMIADQVGSQRVLLDDNGIVKEWKAYHPFGSVMQSWASYEERLGFVSKEFDDHRTFKFNYFGMRYYDPLTARFTSNDLAGQFSSAYMYAANNPILMYDPSGNIAWFVPIIIGAAAGGIAYSVTTDVWRFDEFLRWTAGGALMGAGVSMAIGGYTIPFIGDSFGIVGDVMTKWAYLSSGYSSGRIMMGDEPLKWQDVFYLAASMSQVIPQVNALQGWARVGAAFFHLDVYINYIMGYNMVLGTLGVGQSFELHNYKGHLVYVGGPFGTGLDIFGQAGISLGQQVGINAESNKWKNHRRRLINHELRHAWQYRSGLLGLPISGLNFAGQIFMVSFQDGGRWEEEAQAWELDPSRWMFYWGGRRP